MSDLVVRPYDPWPLDVACFFLFCCCCCAQSGEPLVTFLALRTLSDCLPFDDPVVVCDGWRVCESGRFQPSLHRARFSGQHSLRICCFLSVLSRETSASQVGFEAEGRKEAVAKRASRFAGGLFTGNCNRQLAKGRILEDDQETQRRGLHWDTVKRNQ